MSDPVVWHDVECGAYEADLPLWRGLAAVTGGPVLDVGAGTGRVALDLAAAGHEVVALDSDSALLEALAGRAAGGGPARVETVAADARDFSLGRRFPLIVVPMQVMQLLGGPDGRRAMLACAARHLVPGGLLAAAIADPLEGAVEPGSPPALPDVLDAGGSRWVSQPLAVHEVRDGWVIERRRELRDDAGHVEAEHDFVRLDALSARQLEDDGAAVGLRAEPRRRVEQTDEYVGSDVVVLRAQ